jgi:hypothetical protein
MLCPGLQSGLLPLSFWTKFEFLISYMLAICSAPFILDLITQITFADLYLDSEFWKCGRNYVMWVCAKDVQICG